MRDRLPTPAEARAFYAAGNKDQALDDLLQQWLASPEHKGRVQRYFNDMFGSQQFVFVAEPSLDLIPYAAASHPEAPTDLTAEGVYHLPNSVKASCGGAPVSASAWWSDTPIMICPSAVSSAIVFDNGTIYCPSPFDANGIRNVKCGCGLDQILCYPRPQKGQIVAGVVREFPERAWHAYETGASWLDLLGGDQFYGDRWLYHHYLTQERVLAKGQMPTAAETAFLHALPVDGTRLAATFPGAGPERAGIATAPAFLRRFNNFRSRIRALSERLLCKDIDGTLNTDGIARFVNQDLSTFDKQHGDKESCATCHFGMDNMGSTLLGWNAEGYYEFWPAAKVQTGHVFGVEGSGPAFLMAGIVLRGAGFHECMAKRAFEDFSGVAWEQVAPEEQAVFVNAAADGPRATIRAVLTSELFKDLRRRGSFRSGSAAGPALEFERDIAPILAASCAGSACHSAGNGRSAGSAYVGNDGLFKGAPVERIESGSMPPAGSGMVLSDAERAQLVRFLRP